MTTKAQLTQLAERVMGLSGPDREVDAAIWLWRAAPEWDNPLSPEEQMQWAREAAKPAFTASLDAAMSLAPEGWEFMMEGDATPLHYPVETEWSYRVELGQHIKGEAATLALAITAAALLARAAECGE